MPRQIGRDAAGRVRLQLKDHEQALLRELLSELAALLEDPDDPAVRRLFPPAYVDAEDEAQYRSLVRDQLAAGRSSALAVVRRTVDKDVLSSVEADAWLRALNDLRLVLGTRLDVSEDLGFEDFDPREPRGRDLAVYAYLSWLQEQLVDALG
jgi:hypothetical protein